MTIVSPRVPTAEEISAAWHEFDEKAAKQEQPYETQARSQFAAEELAVLRMLETNVPSFKASDDDPFTLSIVWPYIEAAFLKIIAAYTGTTGAFYRQWFNRFRPLLAKTMAEAATVRIGILGPTSPRVINAINNRVTKLSGNVTKTTAQQIRDVMVKARADGVGMNELARRIRSDVFSDTITTARATLIARTETVGALNEAAMLKARVGGVMRSKKWVSQRVGDARPRHIAEENAGWVPIDAPYRVTGKQYPHDGIGGAKEDANCRCSQLFSDLTADEANNG